MTDERLITFLKLCELMNYRATAEALHMTQPAVTQQIQRLEREYGCELFSYAGRRLAKTERAEILERYARSEVSNEQSVRRALAAPRRKTVRLGATRTIGNYCLAEALGRVLDSGAELTLTVDNTSVLLGMLDRAELNLALIEGFYDRVNYAHRLMRRERFVGICAPEHRFAGKEVTPEELFGETLLVREPGSGTRAIFEQLLAERNYTLESFDRIAYINSFEVIKALAKAGRGISFVYEAVAESADNIGVFTIAGAETVREFSYVWLLNTDESGIMGLVSG